MIIYRCENPNCGKDFTKDGDLQKATVVIGDKSVSYELCTDCSTKFQEHINAFFVKKATPAQPVA